MKNNNEKFLGKSTHRFKDNPREKVFSDTWLKENTGEHSVLEMLMSDDGGKTPAEVTERDEMIAATVIQWLGSPVGFAWFNEVIRKISKASIEKADAMQGI